MNEGRGTNSGIQFGNSEERGRQALARTCAAGLIAGVLCVGARLSAQAPSDGTTPLPSQQENRAAEANSGFLGDLYARLAPDRGNKDWLVYIPDPSALSRANAFVVEPVKVILAGGPQSGDAQGEDLRRLADTLRNDMREELVKGHYKVVDQPGPGVSALRLAITDSEPNAAKANASVAGSQAGAMRAFAPGPEEGSAPRLKPGNVSVEGELVNTQSGQVEMAFMTAKSGRRFFIGLKGFERWGDIDSAFKGWSKNFRERLDKAHQTLF